MSSQGREASPEPTPQEAAPVQTLPRHDSTVNTEPLNSPEREDPEAFLLREQIAEKEAENAALNEKVKLLELKLNLSAVSSQVILTPTKTSTSKVPPGKRVSVAPRAKSAGPAFGSSTPRSPLRAAQSTKTGGLFLTETDRSVTPVRRQQPPAKRSGNTDPTTSPSTYRATAARTVRSSSAGATTRSAHQPTNTTTPTATPRLSSQQLTPRSSTQVCNRAPSATSKTAATTSTTRASNVNGTTKPAPASTRGRDTNAVDNRTRQTRTIPVVVSGQPAQARPSANNQSLHPPMRYAATGPSPQERAAAIRAESKAREDQRKAALAQSRAQARSTSRPATSKPVTPRPGTGQTPTPRPSTASTPRPSTSAAGVKPGGKKAEPNTLNHVRPSLLPKSPKVGPAAPKAGARGPNGAATKPLMKDALISPITIPENISATRKTGGTGGANTSAIPKLSLALNQKRFEEALQSSRGRSASGTN